MEKHGLQDILRLKYSYEEIKGKKKKNLAWKNSIRLQDFCSCGGKSLEGGPRCQPGTELFRKETVSSLSWVAMLGG